MTTKVKSTKVTTYKRKIAANRKFKEDTFSLAGLQNYAVKCFKEKGLNPDFLEFCSDNSLTVNDMKFSHVLKYGTKKELNRTDKTGKVIEPKKLFSFWLFQTCLQRYRDANVIHKDLAPKETAKKATNRKKTAKKVTQNNAAKKTTTKAA